MDYEGYTWEPYETVTEDGWHLALLRITGRVNGDSNVEKHSTPVLITHGLTMSATSWVEDYEDPIWPLKLVDRGYDVWMASNRGTTYSNVNDKDGKWSDEERWDFCYAEMGRYDQPANIRKILEVTGQERVTYIGFSQGTEQMFYGLGTEFEFYKEHLRDVIMLAPCIYEENTYEGIVEEFLPLYEAGEYYTGEDGANGPYKSMQYTYQNYVEDQF